jgi:hypothetical protein
VRVPNVGGASSGFEGEFNMSNDKMKSPGAEPQGVKLKMSDRKRDTAGTVERRLEELKEKLKNHVPTPDEVRRAREFMTNEASIGAIDQISRTIADGVGTCSAIERQLSASCFYHTFLAGDVVKNLPFHA